MPISKKSRILIQSRWISSKTEFHNDKVKHLGSLQEDKVWANLNNFYSVFYYFVLEALVHQERTSKSVIFAVKTQFLCSWKINRWKKHLPNFQNFSLWLKKIIICHGSWMLIMVYQSLWKSKILPPQIPKYLYIRSWFVSGSKTWSFNIHVPARVSCNIILKPFSLFFCDFFFCFNF